MGLVLAVLFLFITHIYLEKQGLPEVLEQMKLRYLLLWTVGLLFVTIVLGRWLPFGEVLVTAATISCSTMIAYKYRKKFEKMERGERV